MSHGMVVSEGVSALAVEMFRHDPAAMPFAGGVAPAGRKPLAQQCLTILSVLLRSALADTGVQRVDVQYEGGGDEGWIEQVFLIDARGELDERAQAAILQRRTPTLAREWVHGREHLVVRPGTLDELIQCMFERACTALMRPGWETGRGTEGTVSFDVASVAVSCNDC